MPTASTAQILGNNEGCEAITSNIYSRSVLAGDFMVVNKHLYNDLNEIGLWTKSIVNQIIGDDGSIQSIPEIPQKIKDVYKTVWEISQKHVIDYAADRGAFVDQTQSMNIFMAHPTSAALSSMHLYGWKKGLKTGMYYLRSKPSRGAVKFSLLPGSKTDGKGETKKNETKKSTFVCTDEVCTMCSS
jgi:ribonucleotide reductase alpha subunit